MMNLGEDYKETEIIPSKLNLASKWILTKVNKAIDQFDYFIAKLECILSPAQGEY